MSIKPAIASIFLKCDYWPMVDEINAKDDNGAHDWQFNFISIHFSPWSKTWSLFSPLNLVDQVTGARPSFEDEKFETFEAALNFAVDRALEHSKFIVICSDPESGRDLQPSRITNSQNVNGVFIAG